MERGLMWINIIDYRGDDTIVTTKGETLFEYRTRYFRRLQQDFLRWQEHGHRFRCFTQHDIDYAGDHFRFDHVINIPRGNAPQSRNHVLNYYSKDTWIGLWDNDASLYWDKLNSAELPSELDEVCQIADQKGIYAWVPFNAQAAPYPKQVPVGWTFKPTVQLKGTMTFLKTTDLRMNEQQASRDDIEYAFELTLQGKKVGLLEQASLLEHRSMFSTIFKKIKDAPINKDRLEKYAIANQELFDQYGMTIKDFAAKQRELWK